jgi:DNA replicative helicase MCM subunit Mcm2 (Cdc46/Mcm family)
LQLEHWKNEESYRIHDTDRCSIKAFLNKLVIDICLSSNKRPTCCFINGSFANKQVVRLQETLDAILEGETPHTISLCLYNTMVDAVKPGDRVEVCTFLLLNTTFEEGSLNFRFLPSLFYSRLGPCRFV